MDYTLPPLHYTVTVALSSDQDADTDTPIPDRHRCQIGKGNILGDHVEFILYTALVVCSLVLINHNT